MSQLNIAVVIPNWNGKELLGPCLDSLIAQTQKVQIVVVDNGSRDGSVDFVRKNYPKVKLIQLKTNTGFTGGVNTGIEHAMKSGADFVALFNNDAVADENWLKNLVETAIANPKAGIVTSKLMLMDKKHLDSTGDFFTVWGLPFPRGRNEIDNGQYDKLTDVFGASGGASLYRVKMFEEIGLFDQDFFAYFEDVDISFRAQLAGWKVLYEPKAIAYHHMNATSSKLGTFSLYHSSKNFLLLYAKNMPTKLYWKYLLFFKLQWLRWFTTSLLRGNVVPFMKGTFAAIGLHKSTREKRKAIQASRKVSVEEIDSKLYHHRPPKPHKLEAS